MKGQNEDKTSHIISIIYRRMKKLYEMYIKVQMYLYDLYKSESAQKFILPADKMLEYSYRK